MAIAVSTSMLNEVRDALKGANPNRDGLIPLRAMTGHFCSLKEGDYKPVPSGMWLGFGEARSPGRMKLSFQAARSIG
jgi:hypothetical protein